MSASSSLLPDSSGYASNSAAWVDAYPGIHTDRQTPASALGRRWHRERRRRKIGRAYDMALEIARLIPSDSKVLDVGCGNGYIAHHLGSLLRHPVTGIDLSSSTDAPIVYQQFDGLNFPVPTASHDAALLCYVLHHTQNLTVLLSELHRALRKNSLLVVYEDIPFTWWDRLVCSVHNLKWKTKTGPCTFRSEVEWRNVFMTAGFEVIHERQLSRFRNFAHPVSRRLFVLKKP